MKAFITNIKRFAVHDGDGIRTTVFFKGCPLKCVWCHNPETISAKKEIALYRHKCIGCRKCVQICDCHGIMDGVHGIQREGCVYCGECVRACPQEAIEIIGTEMSVEEVFHEAIADRNFFEESGGGVTLSGGECLLRADFCAELLAWLKKENIHTAVDTCGFVPKRAIDSVMPYTDVFLYDIKAVDESVHKKCTGQSNKLILENLKYIDSCGKKTEIRIPYVPGYNSGETDKIFNLLPQFKNITKIRVLPYHNYAGSKYEALGLADTLPKKLPTAEELEELQSRADEILS